MVHALICTGVLPSQYDPICQFSGMGNPPVDESKCSSGGGRACVYSHRLQDVDYRTLGQILVVLQPYTECTDTESNNLPHRGQSVDY